MLRKVFQTVGGEIPLSKYDLTGQVFGKLTVVKLSGLVDKNRGRLWECKCDCGNVIYTSTTFLTHGKRKSCGCMKKRCTEHGKPFTDCVSYRPSINKGCIALTERLCESKGECKFYKQKSVMEP